MFAQGSPGYVDNVVLLDSTPVECGRSVDTARRSQLAVACAHRYSRSHGLPRLQSARLRAQIATKQLTLAPGVWLNHYLGQPTRAFAALATQPDAESAI